MPDDLDERLRHAFGTVVLPPAPDSLTETLRTMPSRAVTRSGLRRRQIWLLPAAAIAAVVVAAVALNVPPAGRGPTAVGPGAGQASQPASSAAASPTTPVATARVTPPLATHMPAPADRPGGDEGPRVDWDHPFGPAGVPRRRGGARTNVDPQAIVATPEKFHLTLRPRLPRFAAGRLRWVDASNGGTTVAFMFDFAGDPRFGRDARVQVEESRADMTQRDLGVRRWEGTHSFTRVGDTTILVEWYKEDVLATFIRAGVQYEILGPALGRDAALALAIELAKQLQ